MFCLKLLIVHLNKSAGIFHLSKGIESLDYVKKIKKPTEKSTFDVALVIRYQSLKIENISRKLENPNLDLPKNVFPLFRSRRQWPSGYQKERKQKKNIKISCNLHVIVEGNL